MCDIPNIRFHAQNGYNGPIIEIARVKLPSTMDLSLSQFGSVSSPS